MFNFISLSFALFGHLLFTSFICKKLNINNHGHGLALFLASFVITGSLLGGLGILTTPSLFLYSSALIVLFRKEIKTFSTEFKSNLNKIDYIFLTTLAFISVLLNILLPLKEIDSISYHLPIVNQLVNTGSVWQVFDVGFISPNTYFPANHELLQAILQLISGQANLGFLITLVGIFILYLTIRNYTNKPLLSIASTSTILSIPFFLEQINNLQVDLFLVCLSTSSILLLIQALETKETTKIKSNLIISFILLGLALGTKYNSVLQLITITPLITFAAWKLKTHLKKNWWIPLVSILTGSIWYLRNLIFASNPIYPFQAKITNIGFTGHKKFLTDMKGTSILNAIQENGFTETFSTLTNHEQFYTLGIPLSLITLALAILCSFTLLFHKKHRILSLCLLTTLILQILAYLNSPYTFVLWAETIRYTSGVFTICLILFVLLGNQLTHKKYQYSFIILLSGLSIANLAITNPFLKKLVLETISSNLTSYNIAIISLIILLTGLVYSIIYKVKKKQSLKQSILLLLILVSISLIGTTNQNQTSRINYLKQTLVGFNRLAPTYEKILELIPLKDRPSTKITLSGINHYSLFQEAGFETTYINIDGCTNCHYPHYKDQDNSIRGNPNKEGWINAIIDSNIDYLIVGITNHHNDELTLIEDNWAKKHPEIFEAVYNANNISIYKISN